MRWRANQYLICEYENSFLGTEVHTIRKKYEYAWYAQIYI